MKLSALAAIVLLVQAPSPAPQQQPAKGAIEGTILRSDTREPLADVSITLGAGRFNEGPIATTTDRNGRFAIRDLNPGNYPLTAALNGFVKHVYGQRGTTLNPAAAAVAPGQTLNLEMLLTPAGNVTGRIHDGGDPLAGIPVVLLRYAFNNQGQRTFQLAGSSKSNDRGEYRIYWITPGRYYLYAGGLASGLGSMFFSGGPNANPNEVQVPYAPVFYPGATDLKSARTIEVLPGAELRGHDFVLARQRLYRIRGSVIDASSGKAPAAAQINVRAETLTGSGGSSSGNFYNAATGTFEIGGLIPGGYVITATVINNPPARGAGGGGGGAGGAGGGGVPPPPPPPGQPGARLTGTAAVRIESSDANGVTVVVGGGNSISGRVTVNGVTGDPSGRVILLSAVTNTSLLATMNPDGTFTFADLPTGDYRLRLLLPVLGNYLKSATYGEVDALAQAFSVSSANNRPLNIVVAPNAAQVNGRVIDAQGRPVANAQVVFVPDRLRDNPDFYRSFETTAAGSFPMRGYAPGSYKVFAWEEIEPYSWFDPAVIEKNADKGVAVQLKEGETATLELRLIPAGGAR